MKSRMNMAAVAVMGLLGRYLPSYTSRKEKEPNPERQQAALDKRARKCAKRLANKGE